MPTAVVPTAGKQMEEGRLSRGELVEMKDAASVPLHRAAGPLPSGLHFTDQQTLWLGISFCSFEYEFHHTKTLQKIQKRFLTGIKLQKYIGVLKSKRGNDDQNVKLLELVTPTGKFTDVSVCMCVSVTHLFDSSPL